MRLRRKNAATAAEEMADPTATEAAASAVEDEAAGSGTDPRANGPWDISEKTIGDDPTYIDLGALIIKGEAGMNLQLPTDGESDIIGSAVLMTEDAGLELRAFAAKRSGGMWEEIRADLIEEVDKLGGSYEVVEGAFGTELRVRVPVPDSDDLFQPSRILGLEGPRWFLRATLLGQAGLNPTDEGILMDALRNTIVVRGNLAMPPREPLVLTLPAGAVLAAEGDDTTGE